MVSMVRSCDGTPIAFRRYGSGPAVVLVGGAAGVAERLAVLLAADFTVFRHDRRGSGDSGDTAPYAMAREVEDLEAVIDAAGGSVSLAGLDSGAILALEAARLLPGITRLAICGPTLRLRPATPPAHENTPGLLDTGFTPARWSYVPMPSLVLDEHPTDSKTNDSTGSASEGETLADLLPDGRHRTVPRLNPATLARNLTEFFGRNTQPRYRTSAASTLVRLRPGASLRRADP